MNISSKKDFFESWSHSKMTTFKFQHIWKIDQFKSVPKNTKLVSPKFSTAGHDLQFQLSILPKSKTNENFVAFNLSCFCGNSIFGDVPISFELSLLKNNVINFMWSAEHIFNESSQSWGCAKFVDYSHLTDTKNYFLHENHQLVVCCKATVSYNLTKIQSLPTNVRNCESKFKSNQKALLDSGEFSDFIIVIGANEIPVHKSILSAHSPVFKAMFSNYTKEFQEKKVIISDVSVETMKNLLQFIYTGEKPKDIRLSLELLILADKYQVEDLKVFCENRISTILNIKNVVNIYYVADLHSATHLKTECLTYIANNYKQVSLTEAFEQMCKTGGEKMVEVNRVLRNVM